MVQSLEVANRAYILAEGQFVMSGSAADIGADPELKRAYLGIVTHDRSPLRARLVRPPILDRARRL